MSITEPPAEWQLLLKPAQQLVRIQALMKSLGEVFPANRLTKMPQLKPEQGGYPVLCMTLEDHEKTLALALRLIRASWERQPEHARWSIKETHSLDEFNLHPSMLFREDHVGWTSIDFFGHSDGGMKEREKHEYPVDPAMCPGYSALFALALFPEWVNAFCKGAVSEGQRPTFRIPIFPAFQRITQPGTDWERNYAMTFRVNPASREVLVDEVGFSPISDFPINQNQYVIPVVTTDNN